MFSDENDSDEGLVDSDLRVNLGSFGSLERTVKKGARRQYRDKRSRAVVVTVDDSEPDSDQGLVTVGAARPGFSTKSPLRPTVGSRRIESYHVM